MRSGLFDDDADDEPMLSLVNLVDLLLVLLVLLAALLLAFAASPLSPLAGGEVTVIRDAGTPQMEVVVMRGANVERFSASGRSGVGDGVRVGSAWRLADGSMVYLPEPAGASSARRVGR
ncbi:MAG: DUF2149 domain-containing protein [Rhodocyclaceae bacterium]|nr:DUF2149 domain-containing protein [Rhodocyclaceae bacterium]